MRTLKTLSLLALVAVLAACSSPGPVRSFYTPAAAEALVASKAGQAVPQEATLFHSYEEKWTLRQPNDFLDTKFACNSSKTLRGERKLSFRSQEGNQVKGMLLSSDECGSQSMQEIVGRYNGQYLYFYFANNRTTSVQRYRLVNGGRLAVREQNITMLDGRESVHWFAQSGGKDGERTYTTSNFLSTTDQSVANAGQGNRQAAAKATTVSTTASAVPAGELADRVRALKTLMDQGLITEDEFKSRRDQLIDGAIGK